MLKKRSRTPVRNSLRLRKILSILAGYGLSEWIVALRLHLRFNPIPSILLGKPKNNLKNLNRWQIIRLAIEDLGPTFVKFGQLLSSRPDILPRELVDELAALQDNVPPFPSQRAKRIATAQLKRPLAKVFTEFEDEPIASASIAQVHRARLHNGREVAVKIQRPGISKTIETDLQILLMLARLTEHYVHDLRPFQPVQLVRNFAQQLEEELDFSVELNNLRRFKTSMAGDKDIYVPEAYRQFSSSRVLTMEFVHGTKLNDLCAEKGNVDLRKSIARKGSRAMLRQIFVSGFFHGDPHPGNIIVRSDGSICFLDFGIMGKIRSSDMRSFNSIMMALFNEDYETVAMETAHLFRQKKTYDLEDLRNQIEDLVAMYYNIPFSDIRMDQVVGETLELVKHNRLIVPSRFLLMGKALITVEGIGRRLDPDFNLMDVLKPFAAMVLRRRLDPKYLRRKLLVGANHIGELLEAAPDDIREILSLTRKGRLRFMFQVRGIEPLRQTLDDLGTRFIFGIVLAAVLVSSSLVVRSAIPPLWNGVSIIGLGGFALGGLMSIGFLISMVVRFWRR